jgi:hypothetical protein
MPTQDLIWVALPNGLDAEGNLKLSAYLTPRLIPDAAEGKLSDFAFVDWPTHLRGAEFFVEFGNTSAPATVRSSLDEFVWRALFTGDTLVRRPDSEKVSGTFVTYPAAQLADHIKAIHQDAMPEPRSVRARRSTALEQLDREMREAGAEDDESLRVASRLFLRNGPMNAQAERFAALASRRNKGNGEFVPMVARDGTLRGAYLEFAVFHGLLDQESPMRDISPAEVGAAPILDFHQRLSCLAEYPLVLRKLGLIVDLTFRPADLTAFEVNGPAGISVRARFSSPFPVLDRPAPATQYHTFGGRQFFARQRASRFRSGFLDLADGNHRVVSFDVDGAGLQISQQASNLAEADAPKLRTLGLSVVQQHLAREWHGTFNRLSEELAKRERGERPLLRADDICRGFRVDVFDSGVWRSLHHREGIYRLTATATQFSGVDEGVVVQSVTQAQRSAGNKAAASHDPTQADFLPEALFLWSGWSLSTPRPGSPMPLDGLQIPSATVPLEVSLVPPERSLPKLRYGRGYRIRMRQVDLAGNGLSVSEANEMLDEIIESSAEPPTVPSDSDAVFLRCEPLNSPRISGGSDTIVFGTDANTERDLIIPTVSVTMAEHGGVFDIGGDEFEETFDMASSGAIFDSFAGGVVIRNCPGVPVGKVARFSQGAMVLEDLDLPEWEESTVSVLLLTIGRLHLRVAAGAEPPRLAGQTLTVFLPPAVETTLQLSTLVKSDALDLCAQFIWAMERLEQQGLDIAELARQKAILRRAAFLGLLPTITPAHPLKLVHAVRQPLEPPQIVRWDEPERVLAGTKAFLGARVTYEPKSTGALELHVSWFDDDEERTSLVQSFPADSSGLLDLAPFRIRAMDQDILNRIDVIIRTLWSLMNVMSTLTATDTVERLNEQLLRAQNRLPVHAHLASLIEISNDLEFNASTLMFTGEDPDNPVTPHTDSLARTLHTNAGILKRLATSYQNALQAEHTSHEFGEPTHRFVTYHFRAISRFSAHFATTSPTLSAPRTANILNTARPAAPAIAHVAPSFAWTRTREPNKFTSERRTSLRVYLKEPWFTTGVGELLAVMVNKSRWSSDPVLPSLRNFLPLAFDNFVNPAAVLRSAVGYPVFNDSLGRFFADVLLEAPDAYSQFVQLALARFQPDSVRGVELSEDVTAPAVQLFPRRTLVATREADVIHVEVRGRRHRLPLGNVFRVRAERRIPGTTDEAGWEPLPAPSVLELPVTGDLLWLARITFSGGSNLRVLVEEHEIHQSVDADSTQRLASRLVFVEAIDL